MLIASTTITGSRQEEIGDAIRSVVDQVDKILVVDTGVVDLTLVRAKEAAQDKFAFARHEWKDFSQARNASLEEAKKLGADWAVVLDTDERFNWNGVDLRSFLEACTAEVVLVESDSGYYPKEKIIRLSSGARYVGPTHEALLGGSRVTMPRATFSELGKTADQAHHKFVRDIELLSDYVADHGDDPRWWYYLGQSLEGLGKRARAAEAYGQCAERRKYGDEAAWAAYKQAEQLFMLGRHEQAILAAGKGLGAGVMYAENAWMASVAAARLGRSHDAVAWARIAEAVGLYKGCGTERSYFRHLPALYELPYDVLRFVLPTEEGRIQAEKDFHDAKRARVGAKDVHDLDRVSVLRSSQNHSRGEARSMLRPDPLGATCPSAKATRILFEPPAGKHPMNPSIAFHKGELACVVRCVNYTLDGRSYHIDDPQNIVRTDNYLGVLAADGTFSKARLIHDLDPSERKPSFIVGYEDIRLCVVKGKLAMSATVCDRDPQRRQIARLDLTPDGDVKHAHVLPSRQWHEKNWMPIALGKQLAWVYSLDPTVVVGVDGSQGCPMDLAHLRGGATIPFQGGWLAVTHEVIETNEKRVYLHRFVRMTKEFQVQGVSPSWVFAHHGIEFCAGLAEEKGDLIMTYGLEDKEAWMMHVRVEEVLSMKWITP